MHVSKVLRSMKDASIHIRMSTDMITPNGGKANATLGATAHATRTFEASNEGEFICVNTICTASPTVAQMKEF